jgi:hypothetical protein
MGVKTLAGTGEKASRRAVQAELVSQIIGLQRRVKAALRENAILAERVRMLEETVVKLGTTQAERARYELRALGNNSLVYMLKPKERGTEPPHWACSSCFREGEISILQRNVRMSRGILYRCPRCSGHLTARHPPAWMDIAMGKVGSRRTRR